MSLKVDRLSFAFGEKKVLREVSFEVEDGEMLGLMGPNGSGKTTLLRCLMDYLPSESEAILVDMKPLHTLSPRELAQRFGVVPQASNTDFAFTAFDIVMMGRIPHIGSMLSGESASDAEVVKKAMERTDTWRLAGRRFSELSGGERQRVVIARAIAQQPKALLLDEPTVYLDINGQFEIMDLIKDLNQKEGITVIAVLHDVNLAARYCDRIALLNDGALETVGTPDSVLTPETIQSVYGIEVVVRRDPFTRAVYVMPRTPGPTISRHGTKVHLISGGGTGGPLMKILLDHGYTVSTGVVNVLDDDYVSAKDLKVPVVAEVPFSQISDDAHAQNLGMIKESSLVVVSAFPVGPGNFKNLEAAKSALDAGKEVIVLRPNTGPPIDFVGGRADSFIKGLIAAGASPTDDLGRTLKELSEGREAR